MNEILWIYGICYICVFVSPQVCKMHALMWDPGTVILHWNLNWQLNLSCGLIKYISNDHLTILAGLERALTYHGCSSYSLLIRIIIPIGFLIN